MSAMAARPVAPCRGEAGCAPPARADMSVVPVASSARPAQKRARWVFLSVPARRSENTPSV